MGLANAGLSLATLTVECDLDPSLPEIVRAHLYLLMRRLIKYHDRTRIQGTFRVSVIDIDELFQVALIAMWQASQHYDPTQEIDFEHYANRAISNALHDLREKSEILNINDRLMTDLIGDQDVSVFQMEDPSSEIDFENASMTLELLSFVKSLTNHQRKILHLLLCGYNQTECARHLGLDPRGVNKAVGAVKQAVKKFAIAHNYQEWLKLFPEKGGSHD